MATERFFFTGGALPQDAPSYIVRRADTLLYESLCTGEFCYILDTRQSGKSSLKVRTATRLHLEGFTVVDLDLTRIGQPSVPDQWYYGLLLDIGDQLNLLEPLREFWREHKVEVGPLQRWLMALRQVVLERTPERLVVFIDEIDAVRSLPFSTDEFFAGIRECYQRRSQDPAYERLTFCLLGVAAPSDLIRDVRTTPFNIGRRIELTDFTLEEAAPLAEGLLPNPPSGGLGRILYWTGGHPYLTQRLCRAIAEYASEYRISNIEYRDVDRLCAELFLTAKARETDDNLMFVSNRILRGSEDVAALLTLYRQVWAGNRIRDDSTNPLIAELKLAGIVRVEAGGLQVRNRIYAQEFDATWIRESMPDAEAQRQRAAYRRGIIRASSVYGIVTLVICGLALATLWQKHLADLSAEHAHKAEAHAQAEATRANQESANARRQLYFANMELAPREWENSRIGHLLQLLDETKDNENQNWEWHYWNRLCHRELLTIPTTSGIVSVAIASDGARLAIPQSNGVKIYDGKTGREQMRLKAEDTINAVAFSPDGKHLVMGYGSGVITLWDLETRRQLRTLSDPLQAMIQHRSSSGLMWEINLIHFSSNGKYIMTTATGLSLTGKESSQATTAIWDAETGRNIHTLSEAYSAAFSPNGERIVTGDNIGNAHLWDVATGRLLVSWQGASSLLTSVDFSPNGQRVAVGSLDGTVQVWDVVEKREVWKIRHATGAVGIGFSPDGNRLLTGGNDGTAKVWEAQSGHPLLTLRHSEPIRFCSFYPDGRRIVTISGGSSLNSKATVRVWDAASDRRSLSFPAQTDFVTALAFSPDGKRLVTGGNNLTARVWEVASGRKLLVLKGHMAAVYAVAYSPDGKRIVTGCNDSLARVWDAQTGSLLFVLKGGVGWVNAVAWSPDGQRIVTGHEDKTAKVWDAKTGQILATLQGHTDRVMSVAFSPDNKQIVTASADYKAKLWEVASSHEIRMLPKFENWLWAAAFSPDGKRVVLGCQDGIAHIFEAVTGREEGTLQGHTANVHAVAFSPDGKRVVTGSHDGTVRLWDADNGRETLLLTYPREVYAVAFSPDGNRIAAGGEDGTVQIWSASE